MRILFLCAVLILAISGAWASEKKPNLNNLDKPIELHAGDVPRMYVIFNHSSHKKIPCRICHHDGLPGNRYASCVNSECHAITSPSSREPLSVYMAYHARDMDRSCRGCHKAQSAKHPEFRGCKPCHQSAGSQKYIRELREARKK